MTLNVRPASEKPEKGASIIALDGQGCLAHGSLNSDGNINWYDTDAFMAPTTYWREVVTWINESDLIEYMKSQGGAEG